MQEKLISVHTSDERRWQEVEAALARIQRLAFDVEPEGHVRARSRRVLPGIQCIDSELGHLAATRQSQSSGELALRSLSGIQTGGVENLRLGSLLIVVSSAEQSARE